jgi:ribA/ribD-fused uncharacterized protein
MTFILLYFFVGNDYDELASELCNHITGFKAQHENLKKRMYQSIKQPKRETEMEAEAVKFWHHNESNGFLSNLFDAPIEIENSIWPTSEHYYQAMKHDDVVVIEKIRRQKKALNSKFVSRKACKRLKRWPNDEHKLSSMRIAIKAKFDQHPILKSKLLRTAPLKIIEDSPKDPYWGNGKKEEGKNMMGVLLMELRSFYILTPENNTGNLK